MVIKLLVFVVCLYLALEPAGRRQAEGVLVSQTAPYSEARHVG